MSALQPSPQRQPPLSAKVVLAFGSGPRSLEDGKLNDWNGGRGVYFKDPDGHVLELMTAPQ